MRIALLLLTLASTACTPSDVTIDLGPVENNGRDLAASVTITNHTSRMVRICNHPGNLHLLVRDTAGVWDWRCQAELGMPRDEDWVIVMPGESFEARLDGCLRPGDYRVLGVYATYDDGIHEFKSNEQRLNQ